ncbi:hypothetical protein [Dinghuibacter silviterrae]|nr:hypothetical protein [Dinghuibacter silviterrae]
MGITKLWTGLPVLMGAILTVSPTPAQVKVQQVQRSPVTGVIPVRPPRVDPPDTLNFGNFVLVVDSFTSRGAYNVATQTFTGLSGVGTIHFGCQRPIIVWGPVPVGPVKAVAQVGPVKAVGPVSAVVPARLQTVDIVDQVSDPSRQLSVSQAKALGISLGAGEHVQVQSPTSIAKNANLAQLIGPVHWIQPGVTVRFDGVSTHPLRAGYGDVSVGTASYPASPGGGPFTLDVAAGFQLTVDTMTIRPGQNAAATGRLWLPNTLTGPGNCQGASIGLGTISLSNACEFYKELPDSNYGTWGVGNTTLTVHGHGYVADFSSTQHYSGDPHPASWKGVDLLNGSSDGTTGDTVLSNIGYLQGHYTYALASVDGGGLAAGFILASPYTYYASQPLGYIINFDTARINVDSSQVTGGLIVGGRIILPRTAARLLDDSAVVLTRPVMGVGKNLDVGGFVNIPPNTFVYWGDLVAAGGGDQKSFGLGGFDSAAMVYFSAQPKPFRPPLMAGPNSIFDSTRDLSLVDLDSLGFEGVTFKNFTALVVNTPQSPSHFDPQKPTVSLAGSHLALKLGYQRSQWMNVVSQGVHCNVHAKIVAADTVRLGDPSESLYDGVTPFKIMPVSDQYKVAVFPDIDAFVLQCWESAVVLCSYKAILSEPQPTGGYYVVDKVFFTSTANDAGGQVDIGLNDSLSYWGLKLVQKPGFSSGGTLSVRTGQIILTASGLSEKRHFAEPFWLTWGELLANGSVGRLFFDYNSANQAFDGFGFVPTAVALSAYNSNPAVKPYLHVAGNAHFPFFGADYLNIQDDYVPSQTSDPFDMRYVSLSNAATGAFLPTHRAIGGNWHDGLGIFGFTIDYAGTTQDGFIGTGTSALSCMGSAVGSTLEMNSRGTCIHIGTNQTDMRAITLGPVADVSNITQIWGCACIHNDDIENVVVGGSISNAANVSAIIRAGDYLSAILQITPCMQRLTLDGMCSLSLALSLDAEVNGHAQLTLNEAQGYVEGEVDGDITLGQGDVLSGNSLDAQGQLDWHLGTDYQSIQGQVALTIMSGITLIGGTGTTLGSGFYVAHNAPKADAWVLQGTSPQYALNTAAMPDNLSGIYGYIHVQQGVNLYIVSGQYEIFLGLGAFMLTPQGAGLLGALSGGVGLPYIVGNLGGSISGEILGGLVSAGADFDLQIIGPYPFSFQGSVGLHACVLWVFCGSVSVTIGLNTAQGFYIQ